MKNLNKKLAHNVQVACLKLFNVLPAKATGFEVSHAHEGFVTDFAPDETQLAVLREAFKPLNLTTLFSLKEAASKDITALLIKQVLHYIEVYGLDSPGLFNLEVKGGKSTVLRFVKAASVEEIIERVSKLLTTNAPVADIEPIITLVQALGVPYGVNAIANRELRCALFDPWKDSFTKGDEVLRWIIWHASKKTLLIKDRATIAVVEAFARQSENEALIVQLLGNHCKELAQCFNRHKRLTVPLKKAGDEARRWVNYISRVSKTDHVPFVTPVARTVIARAMSGERVSLAECSLADKFRYLNLIEHKLLGLPSDTFNIRNGKIWTALERQVLPKNKLNVLKRRVIAALKKDLAPLASAKILLDEHIDYGLPVSRKQTVGHLPFGTVLTVPKDKKLSLGVYWRNDWGARDLDLSAISADGLRIGWGHASSYGRDDLTFSGDVTSAPNGACEFFTVNPAKSIELGLLVNIYAGEVGAEAELIVGYPTMKGSRENADKVAESWQDRTLLRERLALKSKQVFLGFLREDRFVLYSGRMGESRVSGGAQPIVDRVKADFWTVGKLFKAIGVPFDTVAEPGVTYDHDLRYGSFSLDKLERVFEIGKESSF